VTISEIPKLVDFSSLKKILEIERKTLIRINAFSDEDAFIRVAQDAAIILETLESIQTSLYTCFSQHPSLEGLFNGEYGVFRQFIHREVVLETCFLDDYFFPEKNLLCFADLENGNLDQEKLQAAKIELEKWKNERTDKHEITQKFLSQDFDADKKISEMACQCVLCAGDYRAKFRDHAYDECLNLINRAHQEMNEMSQSGVRDLSDIFKNLQKDLDKKFYSLRFRLKRSTLNRLESQVKDKVKSIFSHPAPLAKQHAEYLRSFFVGLLRAQNLKGDLVGDSEYQRFFGVLGTNIWRNERYLEAEFQKLMKSVLALKRKDISASILKEYLGEFWIHSRARRINRRIIYHMGPTNSGKTYHAIEALCQARNGCYLAPLRLLAGELYDTMNDKGVKTTLLTGEEVIETEGSTHYSSTIEMARFNEDFDCAVIDEIQMISDPQRGWAWTRALVNIFAHEVHICGDPSVLELIQTITDLCGDTLEIKNYERMTELRLGHQPIIVADLERSDALIVFSRRNALKYKSELERFGFKVSIVYGRLSPEVRREQARKFDEQETDIIVSTDAIAMGMNLPIKRIVFSTLVKHINDETIPISHSEIKQIAGRAGRYKRFPIGEVTCLTKVEQGLEQIKEAIKTVLVQKGQCMVGPDLDIFNQVNHALKINSLPELRLSEFLRLFNTMTFGKPFYCVDLKEMIEITEMVEDADFNRVLIPSEIFGFACAPVNLGLMEHVQYFVWVLNNFVKAINSDFESIDHNSNDIDYLEASIKCVELYQWLSRHFSLKHLDHDDFLLLENKSKAIEKLNTLLSDKTQRSCASCGTTLAESETFAICENCFNARKFSRNRRVTRRGPAPTSSASQGGKDGGGFKKGAPSKSYSKGRQKSKPGGGGPSKSFKGKFTRPKSNPNKPK